MEDWDSPKRTRLFVAAALLTAAAGFSLTDYRLEPPQLVENGEAAAARPGAAPLAPMSPLAETSDPAGNVAVALTDAGTLNSVQETLRDAVAGLPAANAVQTAARSAAFTGPTGRVAGAFAPASAPSALAGRRAADAATVQYAGAATTGPSVAHGSEGGARFWTSGGSGPSGSRIAVVAGPPSAAALKNPAETLFDGPDRGLAVPSARGAASAGTARFPAAASATPRQRQGAGVRPLKPASLSKLLGHKALKAPVGIKAPVDDPWARPLPAVGPDGKPFRVSALGEAAAEAVAPPASCRKTAAHWDAQGAVAWYHDGALRGRLENGTWAWAEKIGGQWWLWPAPKRAPLLWHEDHWWEKSRGLWFLMHDAEPWGYQYLREWGSQGFVHSSGSQMIYSADGSRLGIIVPGEGAILYDAVTGQELGRWNEDQLPARRSL